MFREEKKFPWHIPVIGVACLVVLLGGIYLGIKSNQDIIAEKENIPVAKVNDKKTTESSVVASGCEIWVNKETSNGTVDEGEDRVMIGIIPDSLIGKTTEDIREYLTKEYPNKSIKSIEKNEINLVETVAYIDSSRNGKYVIEEKNGFVAIYRYDESGNKALIEETKIEVNSLPKSAQDEIKKGIIEDSEDSAYGRLEDFES